MSLATISEPSASNSTHHQTLNSNCADKLKWKLLTKRERAREKKQDFVAHVCAVPVYTSRLAVYSAFLC